MAVSAGEQSAVVDFMWLQEVVLTIPPGADPVLKSTDWRASRQCYRNVSLKMNYSKTWICIAHRHKQPPTSYRFP